MKLLVATHNTGKVKEFSELLADFNLNWVGLKDLGIEMDVEENGSTFTENACLKASAYAKASGLITFADDSGLEVEALGGAPGLYTARYGGADLSHEARYQLLLTNMAEVPIGKRSAQFRCVIALADPSGEILTTVEGICPGRIALEPRGSYGFGYDPVFVPSAREGQTMAELPSAEKHVISHRAMALRQLQGTLQDLLRIE